MRVLRATVHAESAVEGPHAYPYGGATLRLPPLQQGLYSEAPPHTTLETVSPAFELTIINSVVVGPKSCAAGTGSYRCSGKNVRKKFNLES